MNSKKQAGMTLIEVTASLAIMGLVMVMAQNLASKYLDDTRNEVVAAQTKQVIDAYQAYIKENYATVVAGSTASAPMNITVATLVAANNLPTGYSAVNAFGQTITAYALEPVANQITAVVVTTGGTTINDSDLGYIAAAASKDGTKAGAVRSTDTASLSGAMGGWSVPLAAYGVTPGAGHLGGAIWFSATGSVLSDYIYRNAVPGHPEANRMNTVLDLGGNRVTALQVIATVDSACEAGVAQGDLANGPSGEVLSCQAGTWKAQGGAGGFWKDPVATFAALPLIGNEVGDVRLVTGLAVPSAFSWTGAAWMALALDQNGNLNIPGTATMTNANISGAASANTLQINGVATINTACSPNGLVARDSVGLILSCQSGSWRKATGSGGFFTSGNGGYIQHSFFASTSPCGNSFCQYANPATGACSCPAGSTAILVTQAACAYAASGGSRFTYTCE